MRVVIAEDQALLREGLAMLLTNNGFAVVAAAADAIAFERAALEHKPDLVVADIRMPPGHTDDGLRAALRIRAALPDTAILVLSQHVQQRYAIQLLAHGADGQIWFRWRSCTAGREQYWHGLLGHDGKALRRYNEAAQVAREYRKLQDYLRGTTIESDIAIIYDFDSTWALDFQPSYKGNNSQDAIRRYYDALLRAGVNADMIRPDADLSGYKLVVAPELYVLPDRIAKNLNEFVHEGGVLLTDFRTGVKDENSLCHKRTLPGLLSAALGIRIEEYSSLDAYLEYKVSGGDSLAGSYTATKFVDWISCETAESLAGYEEPWHMKPFAAASKNSYGKGKGYYVGTVIKEANFYDKLIEQVLDDAGIEAILKPPAGVEVSVREGNGKKLLFVINHTEESKTVKVPKGKLELLSNKKTTEEIELGIFEVAVIKL